MKTSNLIENWNPSEGKLKQLFTYLTGYDIMLVSSREDLQYLKALNLFSLPGIPGK